MTDEQLAKFDDTGLQNIIDKAQRLLAERKEQRRKEAIETARAALAKEGLTADDLLAATRKRSAKTALPAGQKFVNPDNPKQVYSAGRGRPPAWFKALEKKGQVPKPQN